MSVRFRDCSQSQQAKMRMNVQQIERAIVGHDQVVDQQYFHVVVLLMCARFSKKPIMPSPASSPNALATPFDTLFSRVIIRLNAETEVAPSIKLSRQNPNSSTCRI